MCESHRRQVWLVTESSQAGGGPRNTDTNAPHADQDAEFPGQMHPSRLTTLSPGDGHQAASSSQPLQPWTCPFRDLCGNLPRRETWLQRCWITGHSPLLCGILD